MVKCKAVTIEEEDLGYDSIINILRDKVNGARLDCVYIETDDLNYIGDKINKKVGRIEMQDGKKKVEMILDTVDLVELVNYFIYKMREPK